MESDTGPERFTLLKRRSTLHRHGPGAQTSSGRSVLDTIASIANFSGAGNQGLQVGQNMGFINYHVSHVAERGVVPLTVYDAPDRMTSHFVGRLDELNEIRSALNRRDGNTPVRCIIFGMPGLGKTILALKYADGEFKAKTYSHVFWMSAASPDKLATGLSKLLDLVAFPGREALDQAGRRTAAKTWLEDGSNGRRWLLILDNASQETIQDLQDYLPRSNGRGRILVTCRTKSIAKSLAMSYGESFPIVSLKVLGVSESVELLLRTHRTEAGVHDREQLESLVKSIGYLPLAIDQAASLLTATGGDIARLAETYQSEEIESALAWENELSRYEEKSIISVYSLAIAEFANSSPDCMGFLKLLAFLDPEEIPIQILRDGCSRQDINPELDATRILLNSPVELAAALQYLEKFSLIIHTGNATQLKIHDLVQRILRFQLMKDKDTREIWFDHTSRILCTAFEAINNPFDPRAWELCEPFVAHFEALLDHGARGPREQLWDVCNTIAVCMNQRGQYVQAEHLVKKLVTAVAEVWGDECEAVLENKALLVLILSNQGSLGQAETVGVRANEIAQRNSMDVDTRLIIMLNLANVLLGQGRISEAESMEIDAANIAAQELEEDDPIRLAAMENLAMTFLHQCRYEEAKKLQMEVLEKRKRAMYQDLPLLYSMFYLAMVHLAQGDFSEAECLYQEIDRSSGLLEDDHPLKLINTLYLAATYWKLSRLTEAEELEKDTLKLLNRTLGAGHPITLNCIGLMMELYLEQDRLAKARKLGEKALETSRKTLGDGHPATMALMNLLVNTYFNLGHFEKASQLAHQAADTARKTLGEDHVLSLMSMEHLARSYAAQNQLWKAESILVRVLEGRMRVLGPKHEATQEGMRFLTSVYRRLGYESKAVEIEQQAKDALAPPVETESPKLPNPDIGTELYEDPAMQSLVNCLTSSLFSPDAAASSYLGFVNSPPSPKNQ